MTTYAVGDLQGCFDPLCRLLEAIRFDPKTDRLWLVGDLVNRGPGSLEVLRFVRELGDAASIVLGNHDLHLLMQAEGYGKPNREDTLTPILNAPDRDELLTWLRKQPLFHVENNFAMVHAGLLPEWTIEQAKRLSDEVSTALSGKKYKEFLARMWGSEPVAWTDELTGWDRLRVIVNAMTRMRYVTQDGTMELHAAGNKAPPELGPADCVPWFDAPNRASRSHTLICGHWSSLGYHETPDLIALDTGCLWGGSLTALRLEDRRVFRLPCAQQVKPSGWS